jgi:cardiolipin synthase A/B
VKHTIDGNDIRLLENGAQYFPSLIDAINHATQRVWIETYIFADDLTGRAVAEALIAAVARGVEIRVLIDGFGSHDHIGSLASMLERGGVKLAVFRPETSRWRFRTSRLRRMHRKLAVIDAQTAFVGGINLIDDHNMHGYANAHTFAARFDYAVRIDGPLMLTIRDTMSALWQRWHRSDNDDVSSAALRALERAGARVEQRDELLKQSDKSVNRPNIWFTCRDNLRHRKAIERSYIEAIQEAKSEILIANAYFFPGQSLLTALNAAESRGVRVRLLLQGRREYFLQHYASRALYETLFNGGIEIAEYHASFLHAKVAVIDREWATVGSSNIDPFSLLLAREANVFVHDRAFALQLTESLEHAWRVNSKPVERVDWAQRPLFTRIKSGFAYRVARFLLAIFGLGSR